MWQGGWEHYNVTSFEGKRLIVNYKAKSPSLCIIKEVIMREKYDLIIVGMGPSGVFTAYELVKLNSKKKVLLIDQGKRVEDRYCPINEKNKCVKCKPFCNITNGFSGAGAFSDGKLSLYNPEDDNIYVGGNLHEYIGVEETKKLIDYTDKVYLCFGADEKLEGTEFKEEIVKILKTF